MAYSYTRERLSGSEEVPGRGLGKETGGRTHSRSCVESFAPCSPARESLSSLQGIRQHRTEAEPLAWTSALHCGVQEHVAE